MYIYQIDMHLFVNMYIREYEYYQVRFPNNLRNAVQKHYLYIIALLLSDLHIKEVSFT